MRIKLKKATRFLYLHWSHWLIILLSLILTIFVYFYTQDQSQKLAKIKFNREANQVVSLIQDRMQKYVDALQGASAYLTASDFHTSHQDWKRYTERLQIEKKYPGINGIGLIYRVAKKDKGDFEKTHPVDGRPLQIYPEHTKKVLYPITYIEPLDINQKALGLDMAHESNRYHALIHSIKTGEVTITAPIVLVQDERRTPGFLLYLPVYHKENLQSELERESNLTGVVYAPFIVYKLMSGVLSEESRYVSIEIKDGEKDIFKDDQFADTQKESTLFISKSVSMYGQIWHINIYPTKAYLKANISTEPIYILTAGIIIDIILVMLFFILSRSEQKAINYAQKATRELEIQANQDYITKLANRHGFMRTLERLLSPENTESTPAQFALLYLDIDDFKRINDVMGHDVGDELLVQIAKRLGYAAPESVVTARIGGDEFAIIIRGQKICEIANKLARKILHVMNEPFPVDSRKVSITFSVGVVLSCDLDETLVGKNRAKAIIRYADMAMYYVKQSGKNNYQFFDIKTLKSVNRQHKIGLRLPEAIRGNQFYMHYQPIYKTDTLQIVGAEALVRWQSTDLGTISPAEFIPIAENNGLMCALGNHIFELVFAETKSLIGNKDTKAQPQDIINQPSGDNHRDPFIAINCSTIQFEDADFISTLNDYLNKYHISPKHIVLEVTETSLGLNLSHISEVLKAFKEKGVMSALDDFGTGYSSLNYLDMLPINLLKIDREFINRIHDDNYQMVKNIIHLCHSQNIQVIAEGVETKAQLDYLVKVGCDYVQGFYLAKPMPFSEFSRLYHNE